MKVTELDALRRLREIEAELDSTTAEASRLHHRFIEAMRPASQTLWPPPAKPESKPGNN
jgi:hypothetical protein